MTDVVYPDDVQSAVTQEEALLLAETAEGQTVLEVGSWYGLSTVILGQVCKNVVAIDWHKGDRQAGKGETLFPYMMNLERFQVRQKVATVVGRVEQVAPLLALKAFDGVFLDALHDYESVVRDIGLLRPLARKWMAFHDYGRKEFGVTEAVNHSLGQPDQIAGHLAVVRL